MATPPMKAAASQGTLTEADKPAKGKGDGVGKDGADQLMSPGSKFGSPKTSKKGIDVMSPAAAETPTPHKKTAADFFSIGDMMEASTKTLPGESSFLSTYCQTLHYTTQVMSC